MCHIYFKLESFAKQEMIKFFHAPSNCKWLKLYGYISFLVCLETYWQNNGPLVRRPHQYSSSINQLQGKKPAGIIIFEYRCTGNLLFGWFDFAKLLPIELQIIICLCVYRLGYRPKFCFSKFKFCTCVHKCNVYAHLFINHFSCCFVFGSHIYFFTFMPTTL